MKEVVRTQLNEIRQKYRTGAKVQRNKDLYMLEVIDLEN